MKRVWIAGSLASALVATVGVGIAAAERVDTTVTVGLKPAASGDSIAGTVKSEEKACRRGRVVKVVYRDESAGITRTLGTDETNRKGQYSVPVGGFAAPGDYIATAKRASEGGLTCKKGTATYTHTGGGGGFPEGTPPIG